MMQNKARDFEIRAGSQYSSRFTWTHRHFNDFTFSEPYIVIHI